MFTANNFSKRGRFLPLFFILISAFCGGGLNAQNISKYYTVSAQKSGHLYFIEPEYGFENNKEKSTLFYDITYLTADDSLKLNFSFISPDIINIDSISFLSKKKSIGSSAKKLFVEDEKKFWKHRYSSKFLLTDIDEIFHAEKSPFISIHYQGKITILQLKQRKWKKEKELMTRVLKLVQVN